MPYRLTLRIGELPKMNTANSRRHWAVGHREAREWLTRVFGALCRSGQKKPQEPLKKSHVAFTRHSTRQPDYTNLVAGFKPVEDALVKLGILEDDKPENYVFGRPDYHWDYAGRGEGHITIEITEGE